MRFRRPIVASVLSLLLVGVAVRAQELDVRLDGDTLRPRSSRVRFIDGAALDRLEDGGSVRFRFELEAVDGTGRRLDRDTLEVVVSYDIWEERFAVSRGGDDPTAISHLTVRDAEQWCLDSLALSASALDGSGFRVRLEYTVQLEERVDDDDNSFFTLGGLIDTLSRRGNDDAETRTIIGGPFRMSDLR